MATPEGKIQLQIMQHLRKSNHLFWRFSPETYNATIGRHIKHEYVPSGLPDVMVLHPGDTKLYPHPVLIGLEVKTPRGKPSAGQLLMQKRFRLTNHVYEVVRSVDDVKALGL